jgi:hypothetical protein
MPKSRTNKKRQKKVVAYKSKIQANKRRIREVFLKGLQEAHAKKMDDQIKSGQSTGTTVEGLDEFNLENNSETPQEQSQQPVIEGLSELGDLGEIQQVELKGAPPDSFSGIVK